MRPLEENLEGWGVDHSFLSIFTHLVNATGVRAHASSDEWEHLQDEEQVL